MEPEEAKILSNLTQQLKAAVEGFSGQSNIRKQLQDLGVKVISDERLAERIGVLATLHAYVLEAAAGRAPDAILASIEEKFNTVDNILRRVAIPWGRAGDRTYFAKFMQFYEKMMSRARSKVLSVRELMSLEEAGRELLVQFSEVATNDEDEEEVDSAEDTNPPPMADLLDRSPTAWRTQRPVSYSKRLVNKFELIRVLQTYLSEEVYSRALFLCDLCFLEMDVLPSWSFSTQQQFFSTPTTPFIPGANLQPVLAPPPAEQTRKRLPE